MNRQKLTPLIFVIVSMVFSVSVGLFIHFAVFTPAISNMRERLSYYPETLYQEYQEEAERMIIKHEYTCQYPVKKQISILKMVRQLW